MRRRRPRGRGICQTLPTWAQRAVPADVRLVTFAPGLYCTVRTKQRRRSRGPSPPTVRGGLSFSPSLTPFLFPPDLRGDIGFLNAPPKRRPSISSNHRKERRREEGQQSKREEDAPLSLFVPPCLGRAGRRSGLFLIPSPGFFPVLLLPVLPRTSIHNTPLLLPGPGPSDRPTEGLFSFLLALSLFPPPLLTTVVMGPIRR